MPAALGLAAFLAIVFSWRSIVTWQAYAGGNEEKLVAGVLITSMLVATVCLTAYLLVARRRPGSDTSGA